MGWRCWLLLLAIAPGPAFSVEYRVRDTDPIPTDLLEAGRVYGGSYGDNLSNTEGVRLSVVERRSDSYVRLLIGHEKVPWVVYVFEGSPAPEIDEHGDEFVRLRRTAITSFRCDGRGVGLVMGEEPEWWALYGLGDAWRMEMHLYWLSRGDVLARFPRSYYAAEPLTGIEAKPSDRWHDQRGSRREREVPANDPRRKIQDYTEELVAKRLDERVEGLGAAPFGEKVREAFAGRRSYAGMWWGSDLNGGAVRVEFKRGERDDPRVEMVIRTKWGMSRYNGVLKVTDSTVNAFPLTVLQTYIDLGKRGGIVMAGGIVYPTKGTGITHAGGGGIRKRRIAFRLGEGGKYLHGVSNEADRLLLIATDSGGLTRDRRDRLKREDRATALFRSALSLWKPLRPASQAAALRRYRDLIDRYPETIAGRRAAGVLKTLEEAAGS